MYLYIGYGIFCKGVWQLAGCCHTFMLCRIWNWCIISDVADIQISVNYRLIRWLLSCLSFMFIIMFS